MRVTESPLELTPGIGPPQPDYRVEFWWKEAPGNGADPYVVMRFWDVEGARDVFEIERWARDQDPTGRYVIYATCQVGFGDVTVPVFLRVSGFDASDSEEDLDDYVSDAARRREIRDALAVIGPPESERQA
jgi:hypothetical protein